VCLWRGICYYISLLFIYLYIIWDLSIPDWFSKLLFCPVMCCCFHLSSAFYSCFPWMCDFLFVGVQCYIRYILAILDCYVRLLLFWKRCAGSVLFCPWGYGLNFSTWHGIILWWNLCAGPGGFFTPHVITVKAGEVSVQSYNIRTKLFWLWITAVWSFIFLDNFVFLVCVFLVQ